MTLTARFLEQIVTIVLGRSKNLQRGDYGDIADSAITLANNP